MSIDIWVISGLKIRLTDLRCASGSAVSIIDCTCCVLQGAKVKNNDFNSNISQTLQDRVFHIQPLYIELTVMAH